MRAPIRFAALIVMLMAVCSRPAAAASILVGEFRWDTMLVDDTEGCTLEDPSCVLSIFSLTNLWDGPEPFPTLHASLVVPAVDSVIFDLQTDVPFAYYQVTAPGFPALGIIATSFLFEGESISFRATLTQPNTSEVLRFDPTTVPEPGTFALVALGVVALARRARRLGPRQ